jgi:hypothetical protein
MRNRIFAIMMLSAIAPPAAHAQQANFAGTWKLNLAKSDMAGDHPFPDYALTRKVDQTGNQISMMDSAVHVSFVNIPLPDTTSTVQIIADGKEHDVEIPSGFPGRPPSKVQLTATWQGNTLQLLEITNGLALYSTHRLFLAADGTQLIELAEQHSNYGDTVQRLVFDKAQ